MNRIILFALLLFASAQSGLSQTKEAWIEAGDKSLEKADYYPAFRYYGVALEYDSTNMEIWYKYAESARQFSAFSSAERGYQKVLNNAEAKMQQPLVAYQQAVVKQRLGKYAEAEALYEQFLAEQPGADEMFRRKALKGVEDAIWAAQVIQNRDNIAIKHLGHDINTPYSDFGATLKGDTMYYSSMQYVEKKDTMNPPRTYTRILYAVSDTAKGKPMPDLVNKKRLHTAHTAFNAAYNKVYYTVCDYISATAIRCQLYSSLVNADGSWTEGTILDINSPGCTNTNPNVGIDPMTGQEVLYFASDRPGGRGGMDLWQSRINADGTLGEPTPLNDLNTEGDEATPFYHVPSNTLYFSSDGYQTLGGYDVYKSRQVSGEWKRPEHMGAPLNTSYDDTYYTITPDGKWAYLASTRPDVSAMFWDETKEYCCYDIYKFERRREVRLLVSTFTFFSGIPDALVADLADSEKPHPGTFYDLDGTSLQLNEILPSGEKQLVSALENPDGNDFEFVLEPDKKYEVVATKEGFNMASATIDLGEPQYAEVDEVRQNLFLDPGIRLDVRTFDNLDSLPLNVVEVEIIELTADGLEVPIFVKVNPTGNDYSFQLERGKKYKIKSSKPGYPSRIDSVDLSTPDMQGILVVKRDVYLGQRLRLLTLNGSENNIPLNGVEIALLVRQPNGELVSIIRDMYPDGYIYEYPIDLRKDYLVQATKAGFSRLEENLVFPAELVAESGGLITVELPLFKQDSLPTYLPLRLYFDNDQPDPRTRRVTSTKTYSETNKTYYERRDEFIKEFTAVLSEEAAFTASRQFRDFFSREVRGANIELEEFSKALLKVLQDGSKVELAIQGFSSPRGSSAYNLNLSYRRMDAVINHFEAFDNGVILPYIRSGKLGFTLNAKGDLTANKNVPRNLNDKRGSIYSILASLERRVEIAGAKITK